MVLTKVSGPAKKSAILNSALKVFAKSGYHNTKIDDIAADADIAKGTVYLYFSSKKELFLALIEEISNGHIEDVSKATAKCESLKEKLTVIAEKHLLLVKSTKDMADPNLHAAILADSDFKKKMADIREKYNRIIFSALKTSAKSKKMSGDKISDAVIGFAGILNSFGMEMIFGQKNLEVDGLPDRIVKLFLYGFEGA